MFKIEDFYLLKVDKKYLSFCDRKYRYQNEIKNLTEKDVRSFIEKNPVKQSVERYNYDEFGIPCVYKENEAASLLSRSIQPFGFKGYQMDEAG